MALTPYYFTGGEHGLASAAATPSMEGLPYFGGVQGGTIVTSPSPRTGTYCMRVAVGLNGFGFMNGPTLFSGVKHAGVVYIKADTGGLPSSETTIIDISGSANPGAHLYCNASGDLRAGFVGQTLQTGPTGAISTSGWCRVEWQFDGGAGTLDWWVNGTKQTQCTGGPTTSTQMTHRLGRNSASGAAFTMLYDDFGLGTWTVADTDIFGDVEVVWVPLGADGTHSFTANDFSTGDAGTQRAPSYTDFHLMADELPHPSARSTTDNIAQRVVRTTGYVELRPLAADVPSGKPDALGVRACSCHSSSSTSQTNTVRIYAHDGGGDNAGTTSVNLIGSSGAPRDISNSAIELSSGLIPGAPFTESEIEACRFRFGHAGDVSPIPTLQAAGFEVLYPIAGGGGTAHDPGTIADALGITDSVAVSVGHALTVGDNLGIADAQAHDRTVTLADALGITDAATPSLGHVRTVGDGLGITDAQAFDRGVGLADALGITDSVALASTFNRTVADALAITDNVAAAVILLVTVNDALGITDATARSLDLARTVNDGLGITDAAALAAGYALTLADALGITDAQAFAIGRALAIADGLGLTDTQATNLGRALAMADALGIVDNVTPDLGGGPGIVIDLAGTFVLELDELAYTLELTDVTSTIDLDAAESALDLDAETDRELDLDD